MNQPDAFRQALLTQLNNQGWRRVRAAQTEENLGWDRTAEVWELVSLARPRGLLVYLGIESDRTDRYAYGLFYPHHVFRARLAEDRHELFAAENGPLFEVEETWPREAVTVLTALNRFRQDRTNRLDRPFPDGAFSVEILEAEWLAASDAEDMLNRLNGRLSDRKLRLFACACCRRLPLLMDDERNIRAVEAAERYADGLVPKRDLKKARKAAHVPWLTSYETWDEAMSALQATVRATRPEGRGHLCELLRDIAGNPFRSRSVKPSWLRYNGGIVRQLAEVIYAEARFDDLPILADALEDAGCTSADLLEHCRKSGEHARGCWVLDALLVKS